MNVPQYITQLTKSWIVDVSKKIVQGTCIRVEESGESRVISVDVEALKQFLDIGDIGDETFVTTDTAQDVTGVKTFKGVQPINLDYNNGNYTRIRFTNGNATTGYIGSYDHVGTANAFKGNASVIFGGGPNGEAQTLLVGTHDDYGTAVWMGSTPTDRTSTDALVVPTMGWVNDKFIRKSQIGVSGGVASYSHSHSGYASSSHTHSGYAASNHTHDEYATTTALETLVSATEDLTDLVGSIQEQIKSLDVETLTADIDDYIATKKTSVEAEIQAAGQEVLENLDGYATVDELEDYVLKTSLYDASNNPLYVTTNTAQTITGVKTFKGVQPINLDYNNGNYTRIRFTNGNATTGYIGSYDHVGTANAFKGNASVIWGGGQNGEAQTLLVGTHDDYGTAVWMRSAPTDQTDTGALVVPTMGWVNDKFIRKDKGTDATPAAEDKVLMLKEGATAYTEESAEFAPKSPASSIRLDPSLTVDTADATTWTYSSGSAQGVVVYLTTRLLWGGRDLVEFRRPFTFAKNGMIYSVGAETRHIIDTPTKITWS